MNVAAVEPELVDPASQVAVPTSASTKMPPMLQEYQRYKVQYPDAMLFMQVGDFFELFFEDAIAVSRALNLTLTSRDKNNPNPVPMCGVPLAVVDGYLDRLVNQGFSAAIVVQDGADPNKLGSFKRRLDRIITPGVRVMGSAPGGQSAPIVASISIDSDREIAIAFCAAESGRVVVREGIPLSSLRAELARISPLEVIIPQELDGRRIDRRTAWVREIESIVGAQAIKFRATVSEGTGARQLGAVPGYAALTPCAKRAVRVLVGFIDEITVTATIPILAVSRVSERGVLLIDATTRASLELVRTQREGSVAGSLLGYMDRTLTVGGAKFLRGAILEPSTDCTVIQSRLFAVRSLREREALRSEISPILRSMPELERIAARIELGIVSPRELGALQAALSDGPKLAITLEDSARENSEGLLAQLQQRLRIRSELVPLLANALSDHPPLSVNDGGVFKAGFNAELDRHHKARGSGHNWLAELEAKERVASGVQSLKVRYNNVIGYFFEVSKANASKVPSYFERRQGTTTADRFITPELKRLEGETLGAESRALELERKLYEELKATVRPYSVEVRELAAAVAELDFINCLAELADREGLVEPQVDDSLELDLQGAKHPVVAARLQGSFIPNSLRFSSTGMRAVIITGPNMGGKSTYLRQAALCVIMAQIGSFVPARSARVGIVDRIYARIGASDDQAEGDSTFMVEMREAANIVSGATERSLVLIDEIGRGTATTDGVSIAQAILEWMVQQARCRTLFATHFHELTGLAGSMPGAKSALQNFSVGSSDIDGQVVFTHAITPGPANRSYGLEVATLAGLPQSLLTRAREIFAQRDSLKSAPQAGQLTLFNPAPSPKVIEPKDYAQLKSTVARLVKIDVDQLTPLAALNKLNELVHEARDLRRREDR